MKRPFVVASRARWRAFAEHIRNHTPQSRRDWASYEGICRERLTCVLFRHINKGGKVEESTGTVWQIGFDGLVAPTRYDAAYIAQHIATRVLGFGWSLRLIQPSATDKLHAFRCYQAWVQSKGGIAA